MNLAEILMSGGDPREERARPLHEAQIMRLREAAGRFTLDIPFAVGDLVTPRRDAPYKGAGEPHLVIATDDRAPYRFEGHPDTATYGARPQIRVLYLSVAGDDEVVIPHWGEAAFYEPYVEGSQP